MVEGEREFSVVSSIRTLISLKRVPLLWPTHCPKVPPPNAIILEISFQHMNFDEFGGHTDIQSIAGIFSKFYSSFKNICACGLYSTEETLVVISSLCQSVPFGIK